MDTSRSSERTKIITKKDIEKPRSPRGLRKFVCCRKKKVRKVTSERHTAIKRRGIYNRFTNEIIPLSIFALKAYPNTCFVRPILDNQGYDAIVTDTHGNIIDYIELTFPHDGYREAENAELVVSRGYGKCDIYNPGEDIDRLCKFIQDVCLKKAVKDYSDCTLVIVIDFCSPSKQFRKLYSQKISHVVTQVQSISFKAKRIFLLLLEQHKILRIKE
jgi:hypothetical protein